MLIKNVPMTFSIIGTLIQSMIINHQLLFYADAATVALSYSLVLT